MKMKVITTCNRLPMKIGDKISLSNDGSEIIKLYSWKTRKLIASLLHAEIYWHTDDDKSSIEVRACIATANPNDPEDKFGFLQRVYFWAE